MKRLLIPLFALLLAVLAGCATPPTVRSEVTAFHEWRPELAALPYAIERSSAQANDLQYLHYETLLRAELARLGLREAAAGSAPGLTVAFEFGMWKRDIRITQPVMLDPFWGDPYWPGPRWGWRRFPGIYDPFWPGPITGVRTTDQVIYLRQLHVTMSQGARKVYDVTLNSSGLNPNLAEVMPYLLHAAFDGFPGVSGKPRYIELPMQKEPKAAGSSNR